MNIYAIYLNLKQEDVEVIKIKESFSFQAAIFTSFWALYHKMWRILVATLIVNVIMMFLSDNGSYACIVLLMHLVITLIFGFFAPDLQEYELQTKGYVLKDIILAESEEEAEVNFFKHYQFFEPSLLNNNKN